MRCSFGKRLDGPDGRRHEDRDHVDLPAAMISLDESHSVIVVDISATGAQLRGTGLPPIGHDLWLRIGNLTGFGLVLWNHDGCCGIRFDEPIGEAELDQLRREARSATLTKLTPEQRMAVADWGNGLAR